MSLLPRGLIAAALIATPSVAVLAQPSEARQAPASGAAPSAASNPSPSAPSYRSAFDGYRRFEDQKIVPWRESNDLVGRIGGWQAYAREGAGQEPSANPSAGADKAPSAAPPAHGSASGGAATPLPPAASTPGPAPVPAKATPEAASRANPSSSSPGGHTGHKAP